MTVSLKAIRYSNVGADDAPYVLDVDNLNRNHGWGLNTRADKPWEHARGQLALIDSVSLAVSVDDTFYMGQGNGQREVPCAETMLAAISFTVDAPVMSDTLTALHSGNTPPVVTDAFNIEQFTPE